MSHLEHARHLARAIDLASDNLDQGGRPFGAMVVLRGQVVAEGVNTVHTDLDPTAHAEVVAIRAACSALGEARLDDAVLVASCEPCVMCQSLALGVGIRRIEFAASSEEAAAAGWSFAPGALRLQQQWRTLFPGQPHHVPIAAALEPLTRWRALSQERP